jgi:ribosome-binding protein aMBF1 (putative translation factor)
MDISYKDNSPYIKYGCVRKHEGVSKPIGTVKKRSVGSLQEALGAEITDLRTSRGWSQQRLAEMLGYDVTYIGDIERGEKSPTLRTLIDLAGAFEIALSSILRNSEKRLAAEIKK